MPLDFALGGFTGFGQFGEGYGGGVAVAGIVVNGGMGLEVSEFDAVHTGAVGGAELHQAGVATDGEAGDVDCQTDALGVFLIEVGGVDADGDGAGGVLEHNRLVDIAGLVGADHGAGDYDGIAVGVEADFGAVGVLILPVGGFKLGQSGVGLEILGESGHVHGRAGPIVVAR